MLSWRSSEFEAKDFKAPIMSSSSMELGWTTVPSKAQKRQQQQQRKQQQQQQSKKKIKSLFSLPFSFSSAAENSEDNSPHKVRAEMGTGAVRFTKSTSSDPGKKKKTPLGTRNSSNMKAIAAPSSSSSRHVSDDKENAPPPPPPAAVLISPSQLAEFKMPSKVISYEVTRPKSAKSSQGSSTGSTSSYCVSSAVVVTDGRSGQVVEESRTSTTIVVEEQEGKGDDEVFEGKEEEQKEQKDAEETAEDKINVKAADSEDDGGKTGGKPDEINGGNCDEASSKQDGNYNDDEVFKEREQREADETAAAEKGIIKAADCTDGPGDKDKTGGINGGNADEASSGKGGKSSNNGDSSKPGGGGDEERRGDEKPPGPEAPLRRMEHPLSDAWTLWYRRGEDASLPWEDQMKQVHTLRTAEGFWRLHHHLALPSELRRGCEYYLFRSGAAPTWEDPANRGGGRWRALVVQRGRDFPGQSALDVVWSNAVLFVLGEAEPEVTRHVTGLVVSAPQKIDVWCRDGADYADRSTTKLIELSLVFIYFLFPSMIRVPPLPKLHVNFQFQKFCIYQNHTVRGSI